MATIRINGNEYDFNRCTKEQLVAYVTDYLTQGSSHLYRNQGSIHESGNAVINAAHIPAEKKADVAVKIAELANSLWEPSNAGLSSELCASTSDQFRALVARYRKAI